ncbi:helix-turn-helix transcriptional regulator [Marinomonas sp. C2222]|uniref:Helix-turn-helix transcriptional regulator n=1 Tax=Marinomonas sargassi TaxID=2984494 RepID=A0ABT2YNL3_9GAMM|nr:helix-turn-helix transcriptional regulator [Marinomonas sargassi]MCV2401472.1 helix-turn-helix transcriptional regulator [Marinomonas sargassi]
MKPAEIRKTTDERIKLATEETVLARQFDMGVGHQGRLHSHTWYQLMYASRGLLNVSFEDQFMVVPPQKAIWLPPHCEHKTFAPSGAEFRSLYFRPDKVESLGQQAKVFTVSPLIRELILAVATRCDTGSVWQESDERLLMVLLDQLLSQPANQLSLLMPKDIRVQGLVTSLEADPCDDTTLKDWANTLGLSSRTLSRIFLAETGIGFKEWRQKVRLLHSLSLLEQGQSVTQVALEVGYQSTSAFSYAFQQVFHVPPKSYFR